LSIGKKFPFGELVFGKLDWVKMHWMKDPRPFSLDLEAFFDLLLCREVKNVILQPKLKCDIRSLPLSFIFKDGTIN